MTGGYMGRILRVDLTSGQINVQEPGEQLYKDYMGGYGIGARLLYDEMRPGVDPLGPGNILGFAAGPLTGTPVPCGNRYTVFAKSPLTMGWGDANSGGDFGPYMKFAGFDAILITGISPQPVYLLVDSGQACLRDASHLWGKDCYETEQVLLDEAGKRARVACIGPAAEKLSLISSVVNDRGRVAGRSGLGAVMGSKRLKAVLVIGDAAVPLANRAAVDEVRRLSVKSLGGELYEHFHHHGSAGSASTSIIRADAPTKNWGGSAPVDFATGAEQFDPEMYLPYQSKRYACWRCPIGCGGTFKELNKHYQLPAGTHKPQYETFAAFGSMCLNDNLESIIVANDLCNRYGVDTISAGSTIAFAIECYERAIIDKGTTGGIELTWGNHRAIIAVLEQLVRREGFGALLADGVRVAAEKIGEDAAEYAIHIGGQEPGMHDPLILAHLIPNFQLDATPGRHCQGMTDLTHVVNCSGLCLFGPLSTTADLTAQYISAVTGWDRSREELVQISERIHNLRHAFNLREGLNPRDWQVPGRVIGDPPDANGPLAGMTVDVAKKTAEFLEKHGWDPETYKPKRERLIELGLADVAKDLWP